ncbi:TonB-dependent receptor [Emticicia sp. 21SJ11W-3]|uniref:TonB-dependent receptor n=1 Tax=Emticicia sp. 21SJ11W-3 TaxID=2916755 RepID=UPI0020A206EC|nr:TonB-dependent receptor [Emticicia sp. 21SJ11W-3]UTA67925.1 TonB-dependent receptor [Emticicia sp. 21SJ11W-3]
MKKLTKSVTSFLLNLSKSFQGTVSVVLLMNMVVFSANAQDSTKIKELNEVVVRSTRANEKTGMAFTNVYQRDIRKQNLGQDLPFLLNQLPSVVVSSDAGAGVGYTGIRIRGSDPTRINVTLNGVPYNDSESQGTFWVNMPDFASSVQSIQVQRGVGTSTNGAGAFGASLNISTLGYEREAFGETNLSYGSFNTMKANVLASTGLLNNHFVVDARLSKLSSDGYIDRASSDLKSFYFSTGYYNKSNFIRLNIFSGKEVTYQAWEGVPEKLLKTNRTYNPYTYPNQVDNYQQDNYQLISSFKLSERWTFNPTLHYTRGKGYYEQFRSDDALASYKLPNVIIGGDTITSTNLVRRKWLDNHFYGITYSFDYQSNKKLSANIGGAWNKYDGHHFGEVIWTKLAETPANDYRWYTSRSLKTDFNIFGKVYYQLSDRFNLFGDVQYRTVGYDMKGIADKLQDITRNTSFSFFNPKVGMNYQLSAGASIYASYAVGNKEPNRTDFVDNIKAPKPEHLEDLEAGYRWANQKLSFDANFYYMNYRNQLVLTGQVNGVGEAIRVNVPKSYRAGIELVANWNFAPKWRLNANATFSQNKIKNFTETVVNYDGGADKVNQYTKTDISFSPNVIAGGQLSFAPVKNLEFTWLPKYVGKQYMDNTADQKRKLNAFFVNDLRANFTVHPKIVKEMTFSLLVNNILNHLYESNGYTYSYIYEQQVVTENFYYPQAGTNFLLAVRVRL